MIRRFAGVPLVTGLVLGAAAPAQGQARYPMQTIEVGAVAGFNSFTLAGIGDSTAHARTAFYGGVAAAFPLPGSFFVEPQVVYAGKGVAVRAISMFLGPSNNEIRLDYLEFPVLFGRRFGGRVQGRLYAGPELEFNVNCELGGTFVSEPNLPDWVTCGNAGMTMHKTDLGVTGGGGLALPVGRGTFSLEARYTFGLTSISTVKTVRNEGFSLGVGYTISPSRF